MEKVKRDKTKEKSRAARIVCGEIEPNDNEKYLLNLRKRKPFDEWDKDELHKVAVMGGKAVQELHGERKTAKDALKNILTLKVTDDILDAANIDDGVAARLKRDNPNATLYDLIQAVAVGKALDGNVKAMEYVRDTHGDKPVDKVDITADVTTEADRALMRQVAERLDGAEVVHVVSEIPQDDGKNPP